MSELQNAIELYEQKKYVESYNILKKYEHTGSIDLYLLITSIQHELSNYDKALYYIDKCFEIRKFDKLLYYNKANILIQSGQIKEGIDLLYYIINTLDYVYLPAYKLLLERGKNKGDNEYICKSAIELGDTDGMTYIQYGFYLMQKDYDMGILYMKEGVIRLLQDEKEINIIKENGLYTNDSYNIIYDLAIKLKMPNLVANVLLLRPKNFKNSTHVHKCRKHVDSALSFLIQKFPKNYYKEHQLKNISSAYTFIFSYHGLNNASLFKKFADFFLHICPGLNYISKNINIKNTGKKRIGFISYHIHCNHSVAKDRFGIINNLSRDIFDVYGFMFRDPTGKIGNGMYNTAETIEQRTTTYLLFFHLSAMIPQKVDPATRAKLGRPTTKPNVLKSPKALACNLTIAKDNPAVML